MISIQRLGVSISSLTIDISPIGNIQTPKHGLVLVLVLGGHGPGKSWSGPLALTQRGLLQEKKKRDEK